MPFFWNVSGDEVGTSLAVTFVFTFIASGMLGALAFFAYPDCHEESESTVADLCFYLFVLTTAACVGNVIGLVVKMCSFSHNQDRGNHCPSREFTQMISDTMVKPLRLTNISTF